MPELPEVQTTVNDLNELDIVGRKISNVKVYWRRSVNNVSPRKIKSVLVGKPVLKITRRGKYIILHLPKSIMAIHLRMSGRVRFVASCEKRNKHEHVIIQLKNKHDLRFYDPRKFGRVFIGDVAETQLNRLGPEPLERSFSFSKLYNILSSRNRMIKPMLLDQAVIAGLGNIYTDEALWKARIHPQRISSTLSANDARALFRAIRSVLRSGIRNFGTSLGEGESNFISANKRKGENRLKLRVYGRSGEECTFCKTPIQRILVGQRSTHFCPKCQ